MKSAELSLKAFGIYLVIIPGIGLVLFPVDYFILLGAVVPAPEDVWAIRMIGYLAFALGVYYIYMAMYNLSRMYPITIVLRMGAAIFMSTLWFSGEADISILAFAAMDLLSALWTLIAIRT